MEGFGGPEEADGIEEIHKSRTDRLYGGNASGMVGSGSIELYKKRDVAKSQLVVVFSELLLLYPPEPSHLRLPVRLECEVK